MDRFLYALPVLACPVGMGAMMWFMARSGRNRATAPAVDPRTQDLTALRAEVDQLRAQLRDQPTGTAAERGR